IQIAIVVEVAKSAPAGGGWSLDSRAALQRNIFKFSVAIAIEQLALRVAGFGGQLLDLGIDVAVADQNVGPAVVIHVKKSAAPTQIARIQSQAAFKGAVFKISIAPVAIQRMSVAGEIGLEDVEVAVAVVIGGGDSHAGLRLAVGAERGAGVNADIHKFSVVLIEVKSAGGGIVGHVDFRPAVIVEIAGEDAKPVGPVGLGYAGSFRDVGEGAVSIVMEEDILAAIQSR